MNMSEFEKEWDNQHIDSSLLLRQELGLPEDFTAEEIAFAQEMETLFSLEKEDMPPYYVQTLLEGEDTRFQPVEHGFEYKTRAHVFRRLKLRRRLFRSKHAPFFPVTQPARPQRSMLALLVACVLFAFFTLVATGPSFASGLEMLLSGNHGGVLQVNGYPSLSSKNSANLHLADTLAMLPKKMSVLEAQQQLEFVIHRPLSIPNHYTLSSMYLYQGINQSWADGPALELDYSYIRPGELTHDTNQISVCEFKPKGQVLQIVKLGAAHFVQLGRDNHAQAIYVDGRWVRVNKYAHDWVYGERSEIIYEHDGVIFWIVGDQRDGIGQKTLLEIANSLQPFDMRAIHMIGRINEVTAAFDNTTWPFADDIVYTNEPGGSSLQIVGTNLSSSNTHVPPNQVPAQ
ncbi:MAG: hypothetical protein NVS4B12_22430 [Ktedonobacteraceae bacterium]